MVSQVAICNCQAVTSESVHLADRTVYVVREAVKNLGEASSALGRMIMENILNAGIHSLFY